jgi:cell division protein FtsL
MAKNRKSQSAALRFGPAVKALLLCLFIGGSGVGYVWQKSQITQLGQQIKQRETKLAELKNQNEKARRTLAELRSPKRLERQASSLNLGLLPPAPSQVVSRPEPRAEPAPRSAPKQTSALAASQ